MVSEALRLDCAGGDDAGADGGGGFAVGAAVEVVEGDGGDLDVEVDAVEQGSGEAGEVALDVGRGADALPVWVSPAGADEELSCNGEVERSLHRLVVYGTPVPERRVQTLPVVPHLDKLEDLRPGLLWRLVIPLVNELHL